jgi:hypothetical protein
MMQQKVIVEALITHYLTKNPIVHVCERFAWR